MARILIGSSNICRFYKPETFKDYRKYLVMKCTKIEPFKARMACLESCNTEVVISVIENFLCDAVGSDPEDEDTLNQTIESVIDNFVEIVGKTARAFPKTRFGIVKPIQRPRDKWYSDNFDELKEYYNEGLSKLGLTNITTIDPISLTSQKFETDCVHLTKDAGWLFVDGILRAAEDFFKAEMVDLEEEQSGGERMEVDENKGCEKGTSKKSLIVNRPMNSTQNWEGKMHHLEEGVNRRRECDNLIFARVREELDLISNGKKEDRVIITGLSSSTPAPNSLEEKKKWLMEVVTKLLNKIDPELEKNIAFINQGKNRGKEIPMVEVRFTSKEWAKKARLNFVNKLKNGEDFGRIHMANSVCLATRVRVDILKAIAKQFSNPEGETMYVSAYTSRPTLHIKSGGEQRNYVLTFADAIEKFGKKINQEGLGDAYRRAERAFAGQLEQHFVVLRNSHREAPGQSSPWLQTSTKNEKKRPLLDQEIEFERSSRGAGAGRARGSDRAGGSRGNWRAKVARRGLN